LFIEHKKAFTDLLTRSDTAESSSAKLNLFPKFRQSIKAFLSDITESAVSKNEDYESDITDLEDKKAKLIKKKGELEKQKQLLEKEVDQAEESQQKEQSQRHEAEKELVELKSKYENVIAEENRTEEKQAGLVRRREQITDEQAEARILCGQKALETNETPLVDARGKEVSKAELIDGASSQSKREFYRQLERLKIKLEDTRVSDQEEVLQEYERVQPQVDFLETEVEDLRSSKNSLLELIADIEDTVAKKFDEGIESINDAFGEFFTTMFGGGSAKLFITKHPKGKKPRVETLDESLDETERGVAITVQLPNKKIRGLGVLSGGERSLVSIALLFALSQINPPPFVVLDEADAALDEANSRRFGDMIDRLSNRSQLIIITHNRETMSRADVLYGVTMDQAGGSRLLSLNFSEAVDTVKS
jgi:chromosome segregation protein